MREQIEAYLSQRKAEGLALESIRAYRERVGKLAGFLESRAVTRWQDVTPKDVDAFARSIRAMRYGSREAYFTTIRPFFRWLAERGKILADPSRHLALPRPDKDDLPLAEPPLSEEEVALLLDTQPRRNALDLRNTVFLELLYSAGLRLSEALALDVKDMDFEGRVVRVRRGKGGVPRDLPMLRGLHGALRDYLALRRSLLKGPDAGALLLNIRGQRLNKNAAEQYFKRLNARARLKRHLHAHLFRHSIAVHLLRGGADIRYVQEFLGHADLNTTKTYLRLVPADLRKAYDAAMPEIAVKVG